MPKLKIRRNENSSSTEGSCYGGTTRLLVKGAGTLLLLAAIGLVLLASNARLELDTIPLTGRRTELQLQQSILSNDGQQPATSTTTTTNDPDSDLPYCDELMSRPDSPYADGDVLSRPTTPVRWKLRPDGSRELQLREVCRLKRYTYTEAQQCLAGHHISWIGDSITRYLYLSLSYFLERGSYPPRFGHKNRNLATNGGQTPNHCTHFDANGQKTCSTEDQPNICKEGDFPNWENFHRTLGDQSGPFHGHMECHCAKDDKGNAVDSMYYQKQIQESTQNHTTSPLEMSYFFEYGWDNAIRNVTALHFSDCAARGTCRRGDNATRQDLVRRMQENDYHLNAPLEDALASGDLKKLVPTVDTVIYNRGLWGPLHPPRAQAILPLLHQFANGENGRCFFRSTTNKASGSSARQSGVQERETVRLTSYLSGCGYLDFHHLTSELGSLPYLTPLPPKQKQGKVWSLREYNDVYWDSVHFQPWVYEELNNFLLNVLCNVNGDAV